MIELENRSLVTMKFNEAQQHLDVPKASHKIFINCCNEWPQRHVHAGCLEPVGGTF